MEDILKIVKSFKDSGLLLKGVSEIIKNEAKKQKGGYLSMLLGKGVIRAGEWTIRVGYRSRRSSITRSSLKKNFIPPNPLTNFEIQMYCQNDPRITGVYSRDNLSDKI